MTPAHETAAHETAATTAQGSPALVIEDLVKTYPRRGGARLGRRRRAAAPPVERSTGTGAAPETTVETGSEASSETGRETAEPAGAAEPATTGSRTRAVDGLSLTACFGQVTALLGPNGAGKTTTLECAQGLQRPTSGSVRLLGEDPWGAAPGLRARAGVMLQDGGLPQSARPAEYLRHVAAMYLAPEPVAELEAMLGITAFAGTPIRRLSGGQRQRVALAAALIGRPEIVFLDEPSAGLDPQSRSAVFELILRLREQGTAVVLTTHLLDDAQRLADHVVIVDRGTVRAAGSVRELIDGDDRSSSLRLELTPAQTRDWAQDPPALVTHSDLSVTAQRGRITLSGAVEPAHLAQITRWLESTGALPVSLSLQPRTLEDVFLELSGRQLR